MFPPLLPSSISCFVLNQMKEVYASEVELSHSSQYLVSFKCSHIRHEAFSYQLLISLNQCMVLGETKHQPYFESYLLALPFHLLCASKHLALTTTISQFLVFSHAIETAVPKLLKFLSS